MLALPIARRELLVLSRASTTWRSRLGISAMVFVFGILMAVVYHYAGQFGLRQVMHFFGVGLSLMCLFAGVSLTADAIAEEKRAGTIGLLFLTNLTAFEIVLGKLVAHGVVGFYTVLCALPLLSISMIFGGMRLTDVFTYVGSALNVLFFSAAAGLFASSFCRDRKRASTVGTLIVMFFWLGLPSLALLLHHVLKAPPWFVELVARLGVNLSSSFGVGLARLMPSAASTGWSLGWTHILGWALIGLAVWMLPRRWQEDPPRKKFGLRKAWNVICLGTPQTRLKLRRQLLDRNAFMWLASRDRFQAAGPWIISVSVLGFLTLIFLNMPWEPGKLIVMAVCLAVAQQVAFSSAVAAQLFREYEQGTLEMILSTPFSAHEVIRGQLDAALRHYRRFFVFAFLLIWTGIIYLFAADGFRRMPGVISLVVYSGLFLLQCHALGWTGMWSIVTAPNPKKGNANAFFYIIISPLLVFGMMVVSVQLLNWLMGTRFFPGAEFVMPLLFALAFASSIYWLRRAKRELPAQLRLFAFRRYTPQERVTLFVLLGRLAGRVFATRRVPALKM
jgi:ABC-type transport system involved in multi-copper enzyme maturation permease subunit